MNDHPSDARAGARAAVSALAASRIRVIANAGMGDPDVLPFWFGEPDEVTPAFIREAASASIARGETFYTQNFGIPELRSALADYLSTLHRRTDPGTIAVTASGMSALMLAVEALVAPGDRVVVVTPLWPNLVEIPKILSGDVHCVPLRFDRDGWLLDLDRLLDALTPTTRVLLINSPNNPTGWTLTRGQQQAILAHCRRLGIWIVSDDVYERLYYVDEAPAAPSFLDCAHPDERLISTNSFSKAWLMTGWRLGWLVAPPALMDDLGKLIEYNTSCSPMFVQRAGVAAIVHGEAEVARTRARLRDARDYLCASLQALPRVHAPRPAGAMYAFFAIDGLRDSMAFCTDLVRTDKLGLAPGSAFGPEGEGFVRWCFASSRDRLAEGVARLTRFLQRS
ncbi:MAG TPA: pyridoxal phosphate-dependent aminotransferase [Casimicrobiaceae bacterium]|nr:pyridoxal phosphate-dependent aminotransferase [Casimicrobiaceae bacterium]